MGSMVHEIGHAIGMNHEQKRADAAQAAENRLIDFRGQNGQTKWGRRCFLAAPQLFSVFFGGFSGGGSFAPLKVKLLAGG